MSSVAEFREGREKLFAAAIEHDRDPKDLLLVAFGLPGALRTVPESDALQELGTHHATVWLDARGEAVFDEIDALARDFLP